MAGRKQELKIAFATNEHWNVYTKLLDCLYMYIVLYV